MPNNGPETTLVSYRHITNDPKNAVAENNQQRFSQLLWAKEQPGWVLVALSLLQAAKYQLGLQSPHSLRGEDLLPPSLVDLLAASTPCHKASPQGCAMKWQLASSRESARECLRRKS